MLEYFEHFEAIGCSMAAKAEHYLEVIDSCLEVDGEEEEIRYMMIVNDMDPDRIPWEPLAERVFGSLISYI